MWRQGYSAFFAYEGAAAAFGQEQSVVAAESGRSTLLFSGAVRRPLELVVMHFLPNYHCKSPVQLAKKHLHKILQ